MNDLSNLKTTGIKILNRPKITKLEKHNMATTEDKKALALLEKQVKILKALVEKDDDDGLKGTVGEPEAEPTVDEGLVLEKSDAGKGYQIFRDYSKSPQLSRLHC